MLGDITIAEAGARIGFAGQAVIKQFMGMEELPDGFQIAETVLDHGFVDRVVTRPELPSTLARLISLLGTSEAKVAATLRAG
jgi:acetyl-CoA carboxylase carboxyl transferase subunit beta